jgi:hypothetical protein
LRGRYFRSEELERLADDLLNIYERKSGSPLRPPIQADLVAESVGLDILWEEIREEPGTTVCAEIRPEELLIVMNECRRELLESTPGLYNTTVAHELGHWWLHVDHAALDHSSLPDLIYSSASLREGDGRDKRDERNAGEFMGYLLMPRSFLIPRLDGLDLQNWRNLYYLRDAFGVTISTVRVRLEKMRLTYLDSTGRFHKSDQEAGGQGSLF